MRSLFMPSMGRSPYVFLACFTILPSITPLVWSLDFHWNCKDNTEYLTKRNLNCYHHTKCEGEGIKRAYGYDDADLLWLQINCPATCGKCESTGESSGGVAKRPPLRPPPSDHSAYNRYTDKELTQSCHAGWHPYCQDDPIYFSKVGLTCESHASLNKGKGCEVWLDAGYTRDEVHELMAYCPCTCQVECGQATHMPTSAPTSFHSAAPSQNPTKSPYPTSQPTVALTTMPSASPSRSPTTSPSTSPTLSPSAGPTLKPTTQPSGSPSQLTTSPSQLPSFLPSSSPTHESNAPSIGVPTASPTNSRFSLMLPTSSPTMSAESIKLAKKRSIEKSVVCPPDYIGMIPTSDCRGANYCTNGVHTFGPITCPGGSTGGHPMVFDVVQQTCVFPSRSFTCLAMPPGVSMQPSTSPTASPSALPSVRPSAQPSRTPSRAPSSMPTLHISGQPSSPPTSSPTVQPTMNSTQTGIYVPNSASFWNAGMVSTDDSTVITLQLIAIIAVTVGVCLAVATTIFLIRKYVYLPKKKAKDSDCLPVTVTEVHVKTDDSPKNRSIQESSICTRILVDGKKQKAGSKSNSISSRSRQSHRS